MERIKSIAVVQMVLGCIWNFRWSKIISAATPPTQDLALVTGRRVNRFNYAKQIQNSCKQVWQDV